MIGTSKDAEIRPEIQEKIDTLKWAAAQRKVIPNLPKGGLRDEISSELNSIIDNKESPLRVKLTIINELTKYGGILENIYNTVDGIKASKRITPQAGSELLKQIEKLRIWSVKFKNA